MANPVGLRWPNPFRQQGEGQVTEFIEDALTLASAADEHKQKQSRAAKVDLCAGSG